MIAVGGSGTDVESIFQHAGDRTVVLGRDEQHGIRGIDGVSKALPARRRLLIQVLVIERQIADFEDRAGQFHPRASHDLLGELATPGLTPQAPNNNGDSRIHAAAPPSLTDVNGQPAPDLATQPSVDPYPSATRVTPTAGAGTNRPTRLVANALQQHTVGTELGCLFFQSFKDGIGLALSGERKRSLAGSVEPRDLLVGTRGGRS